jgi:hypothetical protein
MVPMMNRCRRHVVIDGVSTADRQETIVSAAQYSIEFPQTPQTSDCQPTVRTISRSPSQFLQYFVSVIQLLTHKFNTIFYERTALLFKSPQFCFDDCFYPWANS